jgi:hypothetical protein
MLIMAENSRIFARTTALDAIRARWPCFLALLYVIIGLDNEYTGSRTLIFRVLQLMQPKRDLLWPRRLRGAGPSIGEFCDDARGLEVRSDVASCCIRNSTDKSPDGAHVDA